MGPRTSYTIRPQVRSHKAFDNGVTQMSSGLYLPAGVRVKRRPCAIDLFCGCGGFTLGFLQAGWEVLVGMDHSVDALTTYWFNLAGPGSQWVGDAKTISQRDKSIGKDRPFNDAMNSQHPYVRAVVCDDIHNWTGEKLLGLVGKDIGDIDCIMGGPPCQGYSYSGRRNVHDPRNSLVWEFARLVHEIKPKTFVMENVPGMATMTTPSGANVVTLLVKSFEDEGYNAIVQKFEDAIKNAKKDPAVVGVKGKAPTVELAGEQVQLPLL